MSNWASDMVDVMRGQGQQSVAGADLRFAQVAGTSPLAISMDDVTITRNLYINPAMLLEAGQPDSIGALFTQALQILSSCPEISPGPTGLFVFLQQYHEAAVIRDGDTVVVKKVGTAFYILQKVVRAS